MFNLLFLKLCTVLLVANSPVGSLEALDEKVPDGYLFENFNPKFTAAGDELLESDIVLSEEQKLNKKAAPNLWPSGYVRFAITSSSYGDRSAILRAISHWAYRTCVRFREVSQSYSSGPHIRFIRSQGCWSYVGRINRKQGQSISIGQGCTGLGTIAHEIGHALGFNHEQSRRDRSKYIRILTGNIQPGREGNFAIRSNERNYSVPYDLTSVMHYGSKYFSKNGRPTIVARDPKRTCLIGNRSGLSHYDKRLANAMYRCASRCSSPPSCRYGGYVNRSCKCICRRNTSGSRCQRYSGTYYKSC